MAVFSANSLATVSDCVLVSVDVGRNYDVLAEVAVQALHL